MLVCKTMSCDENSSDDDKETSSFEVRTKIVYFRIKVQFSSPDSMMEGLSFFCGWGWDFSLSLEKEFEDASCDGFLSVWVVKLSRVHDAQWIVRFFSFITFNGMILRESSSLSSPFLFVTSAKDSILRTLSSSCGAICFKIFPRWRD